MLEHVGGRLRIDRGEHPQVGHHEDAVHGQPRHALGLEGVDQHGRRLHPPGGVGERPAAAHQQVQVHHPDQAPAGPGLGKHVRQGAFGLHSPQPHGQVPVLDKGQPQGLAGDGVLELQLFQQLWDRGRADHLVLDAVAQIRFLDPEGNPAQDVVQARFAQHVRDAVGHSQVGADRAVEHLSEHAEYIGRGAPDVHPDHVDALLAGDGLHDLSHGPGRGHDRRAGPLHQLAVPGGLGHHVLQKEVVDDLPRRPQVLPFEHRAKVLGQGQGGLGAEHLLDLLPGILVAGVDHRQPEAGPEAGSGIGRSDEFGQLHHVAHRAPVRAAGEQDHVGPQLADALDLLVGQAAVVGRQHIHHDRAGAQGRALGALRGHRLDHPADHHLQAAPGAAGRNVQVHPLFAHCRGDDPLAVQDLAARQLLDLLDGIQHPPGDVLEGRLHRGRGFPPEGLAKGLPLLFDQDRLGGGAAAVRGDDYA